MKITCVFTVALALLFQVNSSTLKNGDKAISPRALEDEVREQVKELRAAVQGAIFKAVDDAQALVDKVEGERVTIVTETPKELAEEHAGYVDQLSVVMRWAYSQGILLTTCLGFQYPVFMKLQETCLERMRDCMKAPWMDLINIEDDSKYNIEGVMSDVNTFDRQIDQCNGQILCLEPLVAAINQAHVTLTQKIGLEVVEVESITQRVSVMFAGCRDSGVAHMNDAGPGLLNAMVGCFQSQRPRPLNGSN